MEEPTKNSRRLYTEPGRRYNAGRVPARPGNDFVSPPRVISKDAVRPVTAVTSAKPARTANTLKPAQPRTKRSMVLRRQMVERAAEQRVRIKKSRGVHFIWYALCLLLLISFGIVAWSFRDVLPFSISLFENKPTISNSIDSDPEENSVLDETEVSAAEIEANFVAADAPKTLKIPKLNVQARIRQVGTTLTNEPVAPKNIFEVGWYEASGRPGQNGAVLLNGHIAGPTKAGIFKEVRLLLPGDQIVLQRGDGQEMVYKVFRVQEYSAGQIDMNAATNPIDPTKKGLNLVTTVNKYSGVEKRVIVFALQ